MTVKSRCPFQFFNTWVATTAAVFPFRVEVLNLGTDPAHIVAGFGDPGRVFRLAVGNLVSVILTIWTKLWRLSARYFVLLSHYSVLLRSELGLNFLQDRLSNQLIRRRRCLCFHLRLQFLLWKLLIHLEYVDFLFLAPWCSLFVFIIIEPISSVVISVKMFGFLRHYSNLIIN